MIFGAILSKSKESQKRNAKPVAVWAFLLSLVIGANLVSASTPNSYELRLPSALSAPIEYLHGDLFSTSSQNKIVKINRFNQLEWELTRFEKDLKQLEGRFSSLFLLFNDGSIECVDVHYGFKTWHNDRYSIQSFFIAYPYVMILNKYNSLMALDMKTGNNAWATPIKNVEAIQNDPNSNALLFQSNGVLMQVNLKTGLINSQISFNSKIDHIYSGTDQYWIVESKGKLFKINKINLVASRLDIGNVSSSTVYNDHIIAIDIEKKLLSSFSIHNLELKWLTPLFDIQSSDAILWEKDTLSIHRADEKTLRIYSLSSGEKVLDLTDMSYNWKDVLMVREHPLGTQVILPEQVTLYGHYN